MTDTILILGANGRFGRAATHAFTAAGWNVRAATRKGDVARTNLITPVACDATDHGALIRAAEGADVILHAVNPLYPAWAKQLPLLTASVIAAGHASGATVMIPGNVYAFGANAPTTLSEDLPLVPTSRKGKLRLEMEQAFAKAAEEGLQTIILRGGDFIEARRGNNWFDSYIATKAHKGRFTYPGRMDAVHAWAYLPDMARAMVGLAEKRASLAPFATFGFEGFSLTGAQLQAAVAAGAGRPLKRGTMPWRLLALMGIVSPLIYELMEMRYLWDTPHRIDGRALHATLPEFRPTPLASAMAEVLAQLAPMPRAKPAGAVRSA